MIENDLQDQHTRQSIQTEIVLFSGLLALPVITVGQLLPGAESLDWPLFISVLCFAVSIPLLATRIFERRRHLAQDHLLKAQELGPLKKFSDWGGLISLGGLTAVFFHFSWIMGVAFILSGAVSFGALSLSRKRNSLSATQGD